jgi:HAMP domain-containing protein
METRLKRRAVGEPPLRVFMAGQRLRRVWERWFIGARGAQTIFETLALGGLLTLLSVAIYGTTFTTYYALTFLFFVNPICALYYGLRMRRPPGSRRRRRIAFELPWFAAVSTVVGGIGVVLVSRVNDYTIPVDEAALAPMLIMTALLAFPYAFFRTFVRLWLWWRARCERHLIWSLMNSHLLALALVQAAVILPLMVVFMVINDANWLGMANTDVPIRSLYYRLSTMLPLLGAAILLSIAVLIVLLPASAVVSYFFARRIKRRLDVLVDAAHAARDGDYKARVLVSGQDEISALQNDFNTMIASLESHVGALQAEREKVSELL